MSAYVAHFFGCHWPVTAKLSGFEKITRSNFPSRFFERRFSKGIEGKVAGTVF